MSCKPVFVWTMSWDPVWWENRWCHETAQWTLGTFKQVMSAELRQQPIETNGMCTAPGSAGDACVENSQKLWGWFLVEVCWNDSFFVSFSCDHDRYIDWKKVELIHVWCWVGSTPLKRNWQIVPSTVLLNELATLCSSPYYSRFSNTSRWLFLPQWWKWKKGPKISFL